MPSWYTTSAWSPLQQITILPILMQKTLFEFSELITKWRRDTCWGRGEGNRLDSLGEIRGLERIMEG